MERWTSRDGSGYYHLHRIHGGKYEPTKKDLIQRVGQYEDTGKEPEIATYLIAAYRAATDLLAEYRALGPVDHLRELVQAEQAGRLVVLPCKVGDKLFVLTSDSLTGIEETKCKRIVIMLRKGKPCAKVIAPCVYDEWGRAYREFFPEDFGKAAFLSLEEAEAALGGAEGQRGNET